MAFIPEDGPLSLSDRCRAPLQRWEPQIPLLGCSWVVISAVIGFF